MRVPIRLILNFLFTTHTTHLNSTHVITITLLTIKNFEKS